LVLTVPVPVGEWTGMVSTDWNNAGNWGQSTLPTSGTDVTIPTAPLGGRWPHVMDPSMQCRDLEVESGAELYIDAGTNFLRVTGDLVNNGTITMNGDYLSDIWMQAVISSTLSGTGSWINGGFGVYENTCSLANDVTLPNVITDAALNGHLWVGPHTLTVEQRVHGSGDITLTTGTINIGGDWDKVGIFNYGTGTVRFTGSGDSRLYQALNCYDLTVDKTGGAGLYAVSNFYVDHDLTISSGTLDPDSYYGLVSGSTQIMSGGTLLLDKSNSFVECEFVDVHAGGTLAVSMGRLEYKFLDVFGDFYLSGSGELLPHTSSTGQSRIYFKPGSGGLMSGGTISVDSYLLWVFGTTWTATGGTVQAVNSPLQQVHFDMQDAWVELPDVVVDNNVQAHIHSSTSQVLDINGSLTLKQGSSWTMNGKSMDVAGGVDGQGATLIGPGIINGSVTIGSDGGSGGTVETDSTALTISGDYTQDSTSALTVDIAGTSQYGHLDVGGTATLNGSVTADYSGAYTSAIGDSIPVVEAATISGVFSSFSVTGIPAPGGEWDTTYTDTTAVLYVKDLGWNATIQAIDDVPGDQGGWVRLYFARSPVDDAAETEYPIATYDIHRRIDNLALASSVIEDGERLESGADLTPSRRAAIQSEVGLKPSDARLYRYDDRVFSMTTGEGPLAPPPGLWEVVGSVSAQQQSQYIYLAPSVGDSAATIPYSVYYISAHTTTPSVFFDSPADSGYSVDNLAPSVPSGFSVAYNTGSGNSLTWDPCPDSDFRYFRIYRGADPDFIPAPANLVDATVGTQWSDPEYDGWPVHYKITALDFVGNESDASSPDGATGTGEPSLPERFALGQNVPNPFNPTTVIPFAVPAGGGKVTLQVFDVGGQRVATLVDDFQTAGTKQVSWDGTDHRGRPVATGVYFYRLVAGDFAQTRKMMLMK
jgi:hypothetical protein